LADIFDAMRIFTMPPRGPFPVPPGRVIIPPRREPQPVPAPLPIVRPVPIPSPMAVLLWFYNAENIGGSGFTVG